MASSVVSKGVDVDYVLFQENQSRDSDLSVATFCAGSDGLIKWDLDRECSSRLLSGLLSNKTRATSFLRVIYRKTMKVTYDMILIRVFMYLKINFLVAYFPNVWSFTIFLKGYKDRHEMSVVSFK